MFNLDNGFKVINLEKNDAKIVSLQVWVNCGSIYENEDQRGLSHFIEHLLFKGSNGYGLGEIASDVESMGGELNAFTSYENTCYYINVPSIYYEKALKTLYSLVFEPTFDQNEIDNERDVILEEINRSSDLPTRVLSENFFKIHFKNHPYGNSILGTKKVIENVTRDKIINYYNNFYNFKNSFLTISGDIPNEDELKNTVNKIFKVDQNNKNHLNKANNYINQIQNAKFSDNINIILEKKDIKDVYFICGFHVPNFFHEDVPVLDLLATILCDGESSIFYQEIRNKNIINAISAGTYTPKHGGVFSISFVNNLCEDFNDKLKNVFLSISEIFQKIVYQGFKNEEIKKAINLLLSEKIYEIQTAEGYARRTAYIYSSSGDLNFDNEYYEKIKNTTNKDIIRVIKKYFVKNNVNISCVLPKTSTIDEKIIKNIYNNNFKNLDFTLKTNINNLSNSIKHNEKKNIINTNSKINEPKIYNLSKDLDLIITKNNFLPLFSMKVGFLGGTRYENENTNGYGNLISRSMLYGAKDLTYIDIVKNIDNYASSLNAFSGRNSFGFNLECISSYNKEMLDILLKVIYEPKFEKSYFDIEKNIILDEIKASQDNLASYAGLLLMDSIYKVHPYRLNIMGNEKNISLVDRDTALNYYKNKMLSKKMVISAAGDFDEKLIHDFANQILSLNDKINNSLNIKEIKPEPEQDKARFIKKVKEAKQSHIAMAYKTCNIKSKDMFVLKIIYSVLSGQSGRLFMNLRDKKSLAYTVSPIMMFGIDQGYFGTYIACEHKKLNESIDSLKKEIIDIKTNSISEKEIKRAKNYLIGKNALNMQKLSEQAFTYGFDHLFGLGYDAYKNYENDILNINADDVIKVANKYFDDKKENLVILTDK